MYFEHILAFGGLVSIQSGIHSGPENVAVLAGETTTLTCITDESVGCFDQRRQNATAKSSELWSLWAGSYWLEDVRTEDKKNQRERRGLLSVPGLEGRIIGNREIRSSAYCHRYV